MRFFWQRKIKLRPMKDDLYFWEEILKINEPLDHADDNIEPISR